MKKILVLITMILTMIWVLPSCGNNSNSQKSSDMEETSQTESSTTGQTNHDKTKWNRTTDSDGSQQYICISDNYHVVNGQKIALAYNFMYWPDSPVAEYVYSAGFTFVDESGAGVKPTFDINANEKKVRVTWNNGNVSTLPTSAKATSLYMGGSFGYDFQKMLNNQKKFSINVILSTGQSLTYNFDISQMGPLNI